MGLSALLRLNVAFTLLDGRPAVCACVETRFPTKLLSEYEPPIE